MLVFTLLVACARKPAEPPNVLLITVDTLRPDALGWVSGRNATPAIDALAKDGFRFPSAVAPVPLTFPSHAALHTGFLPRRLGLRDNGQLLGATPKTLAEIFRQRGYATAAFISGYPLAAEFGLDRGFSHYDDRLSTGDEPERLAPATTQAVVEWMRTAPSPWFVWVHYYDPHYPYIGSYHQEVATVDRAIGELRSAIGPNTLTVFAADHGESLGEHGEGTHGFFIYDSTIRVPLVFHFPDRVQPGTSHAPARLIDVAPTILELLGAPPLAESDGVSLRATLRGEKQRIPEAYIETYQPWTSYGWAPLQGVRDEGWKYILAPRSELYDLSVDPAESRNLFDTDHRQVRALDRVRRAMRALPQLAAAGSSDPEALAKLRSLGYVGAGGGSSEPPARTLRDPKDGTALRELLTRGDVALRARNAGEALPHLEQVLREDPENRFALMRSATALLALGRENDAAARLETVIRLDPGRAEARALLADALLKLGKPQEAAGQAMELVRLQPRSAVAWTKLGTAFGLSKRPNEAVDAFRRAVELEPNDARWLARLAFAQHAAGQRDAAAQSLIRLASMTGEERFPYAGALGILLAQSGKHDQARMWLARSRPEEADYAEARFELAVLEATRGNADPARSALRDALSAAPALRERAERDPRLEPLLR